MSMDEKNALKRLGQPEVIDRKDRLHSRRWRCSTCGTVVETPIPTTVPSPCPVCEGIAFEVVRPEPS